jgi:hypothetical protein
MKKFLFAAALLISGSAFAHETTGPNGGPLVDAGNLHVELVTRDRTVDVFVSDAKDKPLDVAGYKGSAILIVGGKPLRVTLEPAGANRLSGTAAVEVPKGVKGAVQVQPPGGAMVQGRFR